MLPEPTTGSAGTSNLGFETPHGLSIAGQLDRARTWRLELTGRVGAFSPPKRLTPSSLSSAFRASRFSGRGSRVTWWAPGQRSRKLFRTTARGSSLTPSAGDRCAGSLRGSAARIESRYRAHRTFLLRRQTRDSWRCCTAGGGRDASAGSRDGPRAARAPRAAAREGERAALDPPSWVTNAEARRIPPHRPDRLRSRGDARGTESQATYARLARRAPLRLQPRELASRQRNRRSARQNASDPPGGAGPPSSAVRLSDVSPHRPSRTTRRVQS